MDRQRQQQLLGVLPIATRPPPDYSNYQNYMLVALIQTVVPPPDPLVDVRSRLLGELDNFYTGRDVFGSLSQQRYVFFETTGESPETLIDLVNLIDLHEAPDNVLSLRNQILLITIWLRSYPTIRMLSCMFGVSTSYVECEIQRCVPLFDGALSTFVQWPSVEEWQAMRGRWPKITDAVGAIDGTSHEIYRPIDNEREFFSCHRGYHCLHSQVIVDCYSFQYRNGQT